MISKLPPAVRYLLAFFILALVIAAGYVTLQAGFNGQATTPPTPADTAIVSLPSPSPTSSPTLPPTHTPIPTDTLTPTPGPSPTPSLTPTPSRTPTVTPTPSATPTSRPQTAPTLRPTLIVWNGDEEEEGEAEENGPPTPIPSPVPTYEVSGDITNVVLLGSDSPIDGGPGRTDTIIIVSINRRAQTASMISVPRDLYVYLPDRGMDRINAAFARGGPDLLKSTILYNFGVPIHYYARIDFDGFIQVVDIIGGIEMPVSCEFTDWRLIEPGLDIHDPDNWAPYTLHPGIHAMDGEMALWYARSRLMSSDFDRGRRQQQLLRAILNKGVDINIIGQAPSLYETYRSMVETDMDIGRILQLAAMAPAVRQNGVQHLYLTGKTRAWQVPTTGAQVHLPIWEGGNMMEETFYRLLQLPALNRATRAPLYVQIVNGTGNPDMARLAAENLAWYGFAPVIGDTIEPTEQTTIELFAQNNKGSFDWLLSWIFHRRAGHIQLVPDTPFDYNYRVVLGADYDPCVNVFYAPQMFLDRDEE